MFYYLLLILVLVIVVYYCAEIRQGLEHFVAYNDSEPPKGLSAADWAGIHDNFGTLIQAVNRTPHAFAYNVEDLREVLAYAINATKLGTYVILSIGNVYNYSMSNVLIQDVVTQAITKFNRVDFIVDTLLPRKVRKIIITPETTFRSTRNVEKDDPLVDAQYFKLKNQLHLFYPYNTSDNDMYITADDQVLFDTFDLDPYSTIANATANATATIVPSVVIPASS